MNQPLIVAHRGTPEDAPENTIYSFKTAWKQKADAIEGDFRLTSDGEIVCFHDETTRRITGRTFRIAKTPLEQLRTLDAGLWKGSEFAGEQIPTLEEVLQTVPDDRSIFIEIKCGVEIVPRLKEILERSAFNTLRTTVISFSQEVITHVARDIPNVKRNWLTAYDIDKKTGARSPSTEKILSVLTQTGATGLGSHADESVDAQMVDTIKNKGFEFHVWTVNDLETAGIFRNLGVDSITTNRPGWLREQMGLWHNEQD